MLFTGVEEALEPVDQAVVLDMVRRNITLGLQAETPFVPIVDYCAPALRRWRASFVTLRKGGHLIGMAGTVEPTASLIRDVCYNAYEAARHGVQRASCSDSITADVCLVRDLECLTARTFDEVCEQLHVGEHGVLLHHADGAATLTPDKWLELAEPTEFLRQLCCKAGVSADHWPPDMHATVYRIESLPSIEVQLREIDRPSKPK